MIDKLKDANGILDIERLQKAAEGLAKKERLRTIAFAISGKARIDTVGRVDKISETLANDKQARDELLNAVDTNGNLDITLIP